MATSMVGSRGPMMGRTGASSGNRATGQLQMGTNHIPQGYQAGQLQQFTPEQMDLFKSLFGQVGGNSQLSKLAGGDQSQFEQLEAPALKQFGQLQAGLASRYSGMGTGARKSSGFQQAQSSAASDFAEKLSSNRMNLQRQALQDLFGMSSNLMNQRPYENYLIRNAPEEKPMWQQLLGGALPIAGAGVGALAGGPMGAYIGGGIGSAASQGFMGY